MLLTLWGQFSTTKIEDKLDSKNNGIEQFTGLEDPLTYLFPSIGIISDVTKLLNLRSTDLFIFPAKT